MRFKGGLPLMALPVIGAYAQTDTAFERSGS
jgi:hypothetical protein